MARSRNLVLDRTSIRLLVAKDGRIYRPDAAGRLVCIQGKDPLSGARVLQLLKEGDRANSPGGSHFEAAKGLLEKYRLLAAGAMDPFDTGGTAAEKPKKKKPQQESAVLLERVNAALDQLLDSPSPAMADAGDLLYARFVKPEYETKPVEFYMALFKCSRATWFRMVNQAVSCFSSFLFGIIPEGEGPLE